MKLYQYDRGVYGMTVVICTTPAMAVLVMKENEVRGCETLKEEDLEEYPLNVMNLCLDNRGDE